MKKTIKLMLTLILMLICIIPGVRAITNADDGVITIKNPKVGKTYGIYQILVLESFTDVDGDGTVKDGESDPDDGYVYKTTTDWAEFVATSGYFTTDANGTVKLAEKKDGKDIDPAQLAKDALTYAEEKGIDPLEEIEAEEGEDVVFNNLNYGYYLVDSSLGALCGLGTTNTSIYIEEKNTDPTVNKDIVTYNENGEVISSVDENTTFIGKTVYFQTTIDVGEGAENYVLYDKMSTGLTYTPDSLEVKIGTTTLEEGTHYTVDFEDDEYTFIITFIRTLASNENVVVSYEAILNKNAVIGGNGNKNETHLDYGDEHSISSETVTYTYRFQLVKTNSENTILQGAKFVLYDGEGADANRIYVVKESEGVYYVTQTPNNVEIEAGSPIIRGLADGTYYLEETRNPDGYTKLLNRESFTINGANLDATLDETTVTNEDGTTTKVYTYDEGGVRVINTKGNLLPSTGGIGTTLFIVIGGTMVLLFGLLLVTKYRMSKSEI